MRAFLFPHVGFWGKLSVWTAGYQESSLRSKTRWGGWAEKRWRWQAKNCPLNVGLGICSSNRALGRMAAIIQLQEPAPVTSQVNISRKLDLGAEAGLRCKYSKKWSGPSQPASKGQATQQLCGTSLRKGRRRQANG